MRKSIITIGLIAFLIALYVFIINPISAKRLEVKETLSAKYTTLLKYERFIKEGKVASAELKKAKDELKRMEDTLIQAGEESLGFAKLQSKLGDLAEGSGIKLISIKTQPALRDKGYVLLPLEIESVGYIKELSGFLKSLDSERNFIRIERLNISKAGLEKEETLRMKLHLLGVSKI